MKAVVTFQDLQGRYIFYYIEKVTDPDNNQVFHEEQSIHIDDARKEYNTIKRAYVKYTEALAASVDNIKKAQEVQADNSTREIIFVVLTYTLEEVKEKFNETREHTKTVIVSTD